MGNFKDRVKQSTPIEGLSSYVMKTGAMDIVTLSGSFLGGALYSQSHKEQAATITASMLDKGTKKKDKYVMMQLLNPGFDSKIKVYVDPNAGESAGVGVGGVKLVGGEDKSYLVVFDGGKSTKYKKGKYKKEALGQLYKDCDVFKQNYEGEKFKWKNFAEHVFVYDQLCN